MKARLDKLLVDRGLVPSRERAQALILGGKVLVNEQKIEKAGASVNSDASVRLLGDDLRYVSRGGLKLEKALEHWKIDLTGRVCLDVGASTGGFTDCMLQHSAAKVIAIDTGYGQMDFRLRSDPRVRLLEKTNVRYLTRDQLAEDIDFVAIDVSFISATLVLPAVIRAAFSHPRSCLSNLASSRLGMVRPQPRSGARMQPRAQALGQRTKNTSPEGAAEKLSGTHPGDTQQQRIAFAPATTRPIVVLVKPQFEVGRELVGKGGIVRDESAQHAAVAKVQMCLRDLGCTRAEWIESPIRGAEGNREFLLYAEY